MKHFVFLVFPGLSWCQATVQQTNCPKTLNQGTIVVAQSVSGLNANYPVIILACYQLNPSNFSITTPGGGALPEVSVIGSNASGAAGTTGQLQINAGSGIFGALSAVTESYLSLSDVTTGNASRSEHGFLPKIPGTSGYCLDSSTGTWVLENCGNSGGGSVLTLTTTGSSGAATYTGGTLNIPEYSSGGGGGFTPTAGTGVVVVNSGSTSTISADTALIPTKGVIQATTSNIVSSTNTSSTAPTGTMNPTLGAYSDKQLIEYTWPINCAGGSMTLTVDGLSPAVPLVKSDGSTTLGTSDCASGMTNIFIYDGTLLIFKLVGGGAPSSDGTTLTDACASGQGHWAPWGTGFNSSFSLASGTLYGWELPANSPLCTIDSIGFIAAGTGSASAIFTLWNAAGTTVLQSSDVVSLAGLYSSVTLSSAFQLQPNTSYLLTVSASATGSGIYQSSENYNLLNQGATVPRVFTCANSVSWSGTTPTLPGTCGTRAASSENPIAISLFHN